jgi:hypothetical protein
VTRTWLVAIVVSAAALVPRAGAQQTVFRSGIDVVTVPVAVTRANRPEAGLTTSDFTLTDNGVSQQVEVLSLEHLPIDVTLLLDMSGSVEGSLLARLKAGVEDTARMLGPDDRVRLVTVQHYLHELVPFQPGGTTPVLGGLTASGATSLYDGLAAAMMRQTPPDRRHLVVAYTDGRDTTSILTDARTRAVAVLTDAVVHVVLAVTRLAGDSGPLPPPASSGLLSTGSQSAQIVDEFLSTARRPKSEPQPLEAILWDLTGRTGGLLFMTDARDSVSSAFKRVLEDFRTSYVLRYVPRGVTREGWHDIVVKVTKSGKFDVRARKGYSGG